uniref:Transmembrane protein n=1 Tax=Romanomermis culicivorax TaxID=13658 RepID=A0A915IW56_ROMCU
MLTFVRSIRVVCFKFVPTPKLKIVFYFLILELTRSIGVCILIFGVLPQLDAIRGFMLLACLASVPSFLNFLTKLSANMDQERPLSKGRFAVNVVDFVCFLCQMTGLFVWSIFDHSLSLELRITIPVALVLTSLLWWENFVSRASMSGILSNLGRFKDRLRRCRYKLMLISVPCKCLASLVCMCVFGIRTHSSFHLFDLNNPFEIYSMNKTGPNVDLVKLAKSEQSNHAMWLCISFLLFSWVCFELAKFACKVKMDWFSVAMPLVLSMPVALTVLVSFCEEKRQQSCYRVPWIDEKLFWFCGYGRNVSDGLLLEHMGWIWPFWFFSYLWVVSHVFTQKIGRLNRSDT